MRKSSNKQHNHKMPVQRRSSQCEFQRILAKRKTKTAGTQHNIESSIGYASGGPTLWYRKCCIGTLGSVWTFSIPIAESRKTWTCHELKSQIRALASAVAQNSYSQLKPRRPRVSKSGWTGTALTAPYLSFPPPHLASSTMSCTSQPQLVVQSSCRCEVRIPKVGGTQ
jgi:hypothetical protein